MGEFTSLVALAVARVLIILEEIRELLVVVLLLLANRDDRLKVVLELSQVRVESFLVSHKRVHLLLENLNFAIIIVL